MATSSSQLPSPPHSPAPTSPTYSTTHLDTLLAQYLALLHDYTDNRASLSTQFSAGFFNLAQAQRSSLLPPGQRYGEEMYDQRMKAIRRMRVKATEEGGDVECEVCRYPEMEAKQEGAPMKTEAEDRSEQTESSENPAPTPEDDQTSRRLKPGQPTPTPEPPPDPLLQFGLLTPQPLRNAQSSFTASLSLIPDLINTTAQMTRLEAEIERVRKSLGLDETNKETGIEETNLEHESVTSTTPQRRTLASRSKVSEPRSRVLKLGS